MTPTPSKPETAKQRSLRIPLDYVRPSSFQRVKAFVAILFCLIAGAYAAWIVASSDLARMQLSPGPVVSAHAPWETKCDACHDNFSPLRADADTATVRFLSAMLPRPRSTQAVPDSPAADLAASATKVDAKCQVCHRANDHHGNFGASGVERCTACHIDHDGRTARISQPHDRHCTRCHLQMPHPVQDFRVPQKGVIGHPHFRCLGGDPGNIQFDHHLHMTKGIPASDAKNQGRSLTVVADMLANVSPEIARQLHRPGGKPVNENENENEKLDSSVQVELHCSSCHQLQSDDLSRNATSDKSNSAGAYMTPVRYEQHCQACHPLYFESSHTKRLEHGLSPTAIRQSLAGKFWSVSSASQTVPQSKSNESRLRIPGRNTDRLAPEAEQKQILDLVQKAEQYMLDQKVCLKCHRYAERQEATAISGLPDILPPNIPRVWFEKSHFSHRAHFAVNMECKTCHAAAYPSTESSSAKKPPDHEVVMIAGLEACVQCHSPRTSGAVIAARFDCVECHRYHVIDPLRPNDMKVDAGNRSSVPLP
jgi:hypothetical protein